MNEKNPDRKEVQIWCQHLHEFNTSIEVMASVNYRGSINMFFIIEIFINELEYLDLLCGMNRLFANLKFSPPIKQRF